MMALDLSQNKYSDVTMEEKDRLFAEVKSDDRWEHVLWKSVV